MQDGLNALHLKKAKLMFFYTRYPSASTLKTYFPDVKVSKLQNMLSYRIVLWAIDNKDFTNQQNKSTCVVTNECRHELEIAAYGLRL